jgi:trans-aconitate 2-methyltransferase
MSATTTKSFENIREDYAFFEDHATEAVEDLRGYLPWVRPLAASDRLVRLLDFGCGPGGFSAKFLTAAAFRRERLELSLVEPEDGYRRKAAERLQEFAAAPVRVWPELPADCEECFDLVLSNHVLYYVPDLDHALTRILRALTRGGLFLTALAGQANVLIQFWHAAFGMLNRPIPFYEAEDLEIALRQRGQAYRKQHVTYELEFPDTEENRLKILRFLLGDHLPEMPRRAVLDLFDPYGQDGRIVIRTTDEQFVIRRE